MKTSYKDIFKNLKKETDQPTFKKHDRVLIIDGLNLFFRNFAMMNTINSAGNHTGGLGGFLRSLGAMINLIKPTSVYVVFDGAGGSDSRKNLLPEYKSGRHQTRITNWDAFNNVDDENNAKVDQISRLIHYLRCLPIKVISITKVEADDIIAYLSNHITEIEKDSKVFILSSDKDFLQLVNQNITVYSPIIKEFYTPKAIEEKFGVLSSNFILYKMLSGDASDKVSGVKGLGAKGILKKFPELAEQSLTLEDLFGIAEAKHKDHVVYSRIVFERKALENNYKIMDLSKPLLSTDEKELLQAFTQLETPDLKHSDFIQLYKEDGLGFTIKNVDYWLKEYFSSLRAIK